MARCQESTERMTSSEVITSVRADRFVWLLVVEEVTDLLINQGYDVEQPTRTILCMLDLSISES